MDQDNSQRYTLAEAAERIYRILRGDAVSDDSPNTLSGPTRSYDETMSRLAELMQDSLPGESLTLPESVMTALNNQFPDPGIGYQFGAPPNSYLYIGPSGSFTLYEGATVWDDLRFPAVDTKLGGSKDPGFAVFKTNSSGSQGVFTYWFDSSIEEEVYLMAQLPHAWKEGSVIHPHIHWTPAADGTGTVSWGLEYSWAPINGVFPTTSTIYGNQITRGYTNISGSVHYVTPLSAITGTNQGLSSMIMMRLFRNATGAGESGDSYPNDAGLLEFDIHYEINSLGSNEQFEK